MDDKSISEAIGEVLRDKILQKGFNFMSFAELAGVTHGYVSKVVNGNIKSIGVGTLEKMMIPLEMNVSEFMMEVEKKKPLPIYC